MLRITVNTTAAIEGLNDLFVNQVPFLTARALTLTAQQAQATERGSLASKFTLRNNWTVQGIKIQAATKSLLEAQVIADRGYLPQQESGGQKIHIGGRANFAIPTDLLMAFIGGKNRIIPPYLRPAAVLGLTSGLFAQRRRDKSGNVVTLVKRAPGAKDWEAFIKTLGSNAYIFLRVSSDRAFPIYLLKSSARLKPRLGLEDIVQKGVDSNFQANFDKAFNDAVAKGVRV